MTEQLTEAQRRLLEIVGAHQYVTETTLATLLGLGWHNPLWSCMRLGWVQHIGAVDDGTRYVRVFRLTRAGRRVLLSDDDHLSDGEVYDGPDCLRRQLAAAREVIEAARRLVNNAKHDVDPVDVYELREAIRRYDERCGGGGTPTE